MIQWFDTRAVKALGNALADYVIAQHQSTKKASKKRPDSKNDLIVRHVSDRIAEFKRSERLNIYKIAQLGNVFKWRLKEAGFEDDYIEALTTLLLTRAR